MKKLFLILLCALTGMAAQAQTTRYVKPSATGSGDGSSWANASGDLQAMINASAAGDEVWVAAGTYKPNAYPSGCSGCSTNRDFTFHLKDGVKLYGGFAGAETLLSQRNIAANPTILSGDFNADDVVTGSGSTLSITGNGENAYHVVLSIFDAATTVLDGFTVSGGNANVNTNITIESQTIVRNAGGGMFTRTASPSITNTTFTGNSATSFGGGMINVSSSFPTITNTTFTGNRANQGGGMSNFSSSPSITNTTFTGNSAGNGGGMENQSSSNPMIRNSILWGNGTEISNFISTPTVSNSIVQGGYTGCSNCPGTNGNADPLFVNAADPDGADNIHRTADDGLRLQLGSPAINAGDPAITTPATDITGATRGAAPFDLGAYEGGVSVCPTLTAAAPPVVVSSQSTCTGCALNGGVISAPATACPTGSTLQYSTDGGSNWSTMLPTYNQTAAVTVLTRCNCNTDANISSPTSSVTTVPGVCTPVTANISGTTTGCGSVTLTASGGTGYTWNDGNNPTSATNTFTISGTYIVNVTGANGCTATTSAVVTVIPSSPTLYVDQSISSSGNGSTWATAFKTLDEALFIAHNCPGVNTINVAAGTYRPTKKPYASGVEITTSDARDVTFHLANGVAMYGGFPNGGGTRNIAANPTILSGDFNNDDVVTGSGSTLSITNNGENAYHVVLSVSDAATTILDGFTVRGGNANASSSSITVESQANIRNRGGGMNNLSSSPTITNTIFTGNSAFQGGGMNNVFSSPVITNITFTGNRASNGGGMFNSSSSPSITNTTFTGNRATSVGGGMANGSSSPSITNTTFTGNSATNGGGGMYNFLSSNPVIRNCIVWGNGTEISNDASTPVVSYSIIQGGHAGTGNLGADPLFVNAADPDGADNIHRTADDGLRLQSGSPAINAGDPAITTPATDITGATRGAAPFDLGAYEGGVSVCPTLTAAAPPVVVSSQSTCTGCALSGGVISAPATACPTGSTLQYSTDGGSNWSTMLPTYNQTTAVTVLTRCNCNTDTNISSPTSSVTTVPGTCVTPAAPTGTLAIVNSTCTNCMVSGGSIALGSVSGTGGTLEYSTDNGATWSSTLPTYNQTGPAQTILASVLAANGCRSNSTQVGQTTPGTCVTPAAPTGALAIVNSTCTNCMVSGGSIALGSVIGTGGTLEYSTDNGATWSSTLPTYNQTGPAQTILASVLAANGCRSNSTQVGQTTPGTCVTPAAPTGALAITNSSCSNCMVGGGNVALGSVIGAGGTLEYSTNGGTTWSSTLPIYNQTGPAQTILASVLAANGCRSNSTQVGQTTPGTCVTPAAPTGALAIVNSTCTNCTVSGGSIALGSVSGTGGTLEYSTNGGTTWSSTMPAYNQTGPAQTILASVLAANGCRSNSTQVGQTTPGTCVTPAAPTGALAITNSSCSNCMVGGGNVALGSVIGAGGTLEYSTDGGTTWSSTLPTYNQTGPAQTILASVLAANGCRSNSTQVGQTTPGTCTPPTAPIISNSNGLALNCNNPSTMLSVAAPGNYTWTLDGNPAGSGPSVTAVIGGTYQVTNTAANGCNATSSVMVTFTPDTTPPSITCPGTQTLTLGANCTASLPDYTSLATTGDNCGVQGVTQSPAAGTIVSNSGNMTVTLTVTDVNGLTNTCTFTVTKVDNTAPTVQCFNQTLNFNGEESLALDADDLANASDNCGVQSISLSPNTISATQVGQVVPVTVTVTDINGNTATCTSNITVSGFPAGWSQQPGGAGCSGNNNAYNSGTGVWTATSTNCFYGPPYTSDAASFVQRTLCGDGSITAQVTSINGTALGWAGVVMRESNDPGAKKAQLLTNLSSLHRREFRTVTNGAAQPQQFPSQNRYWLRITRAGNQFTMSVSANGTSWFLIGAQNIAMNNCIQMGLVATNYTANSTVTVTFAGVSYTGSNAGLGTGGIEQSARSIEQPYNFEVYPNPTGGELNVDLTQYIGRSVRLEVYSIDGKLLQFSEIDEVQTLVEGIRLSEYQSGMYVVKVKSKGLPDISQRVVLQRQ